MRSKELLDYISWPSGDDWIKKTQSLWIKIYVSIHNSKWINKKIIANKRNSKSVLSFFTENPFLWPWILNKDTDKVI